MAQGRKETLSLQALQFLDAFLVWLAFYVASILRGPVIEWYTGQPTVQLNLEPLTPLLFVIVPLTPIALEWFGFYRAPLRKRLSDSIVQMAKASIIVGVVVGVLLVFVRVAEAEQQSRWILGSAIPLVVVFLLIRESVAKMIVLHSVRAEDAKEAIIFAGSQKSMQEFEDNLPEDTRSSYKVVAHFEPETSNEDEFSELLRAESVGRVIFAAKHTEFGTLAGLVEICELQGVEAWISAEFIQTQVARPDFDLMGGKPMLVLRSTPELSWELWVKQVLDWIGAMILLSASMVLFWWWVAIAIKITSPKGPIFFRQKRAGRYGKPFTMWKFRTMHPGSEKKLEEVKEEQGNAMSGPVFKLDNDPRIYGFGSFLRRTSIDELPQLLNVLRGDMSLVGPRPLPLYEVQQFEKSEHRRRLSVKPGITCLWQAGGRNRITSFEEWVRMDLEYIDNWSLWLDFKILLKTVPAVMFGKGSK